MNKSFLIILVAIVLIGLVSHSGCKSEDAAFSLTVSVGNGVSGTPATGSYSYAENDTVTYNYTAQSGYGNLAVTLDGAPVANTGVVPMNASHTLTVTAAIDIRGSWTGKFFYESYDWILRVNFTGNILSGTVDGHNNCHLLGPGAETGTFTVTGDTIEFTMQYYYGTLFFEGTIESASRLSGTWTAGGSSATGEWDLTRQI